MQLVTKHDNHMMARQYRSA